MQRLLGSARLSSDRYSAIATKFDKTLVGALSYCGCYARSHLVPAYVGPIVGEDYLACGKLGGRFRCPAMHEVVYFAWQANELA